MYLSENFLIEHLEAQLGNPKNPDNPLSFAYAQQIDESERFPEEAVRWLYDHGLSRHFVPEELGGSFRSFEELGEVVRLLTRRDMTSTNAFSTLFWSFLTWLAGTDAQKRWLADYIIKRRGAMCLAYSEKEHGADLIGNETVARRTSDGFELTGEKWPINGATVGGLAFVLAKTDQSGGPRALSLFMVDKSELDKSRYSNLPKVRTHGVRGSDVSGIKFEQCPIPSRSLIGQEGGGLEIALKGLYVTRALCAAFSLGCGDTALRTTLEFAVRRRLYNEYVIDMPHAAEVLSDAFLDLLICDCVAAAGRRALHATPAQASVWSAVVKYFVPTTIESMINNLSVVLGARYYMREEHEWGTFQRVLRDSAIVSLFDGSTVVNLHSLLLQFRHMARRPAERRADQEARLRQIYELHSRLAPFDGKKLGLVSPGANDALEGVELSLKELRSQSKADVRQEDTNRILAIGELLLQAIAEHQAAFLGAEFEHGHRQSAAMFRTARKYCGLHAAASCLHMWVWNRSKSESFFARGKWLARALGRILAPSVDIRDHEFFEAPRKEILEELMRLHHENRMFSISAARLGTR
jgi:alkylation response protein AidB-like acyl-CoA dehydrogenase